MSNLNNRAVIDPRRNGDVQMTLDGFLDCTITLYDQNLDGDGGAYNWKANTGGTTSSTVLFHGEAQLEVYRFTLVMDAPAGSVDQVRSGRFTVKYSEIGDIDVRKGQRIVVDSCPVAPYLQTYQYVVNSGFDSPLAFRRTIEVEVDQARVI